jgi:hypothetical protein
MMLLMHMGNSVFHSFNGVHLLKAQLQRTLFLHTKQTKGTQTYGCLLYNTVIHTLKLKEHIM